VQRVEEFIRAWSFGKCGKGMCPENWRIERKLTE
jgi:hypothetical protein